MAGSKSAAVGAYGGGWYASRIAGALNSPERLVPLLIELVGPASVVDVGCGPGTWVEAFMRLGVEDAIGIEGDWLDQGVLRFPREQLRLHDLSTPLDLGREFDLAISLEVGEHIPESSARTLVETVTRHAPVAVFSAAAPLQGGTQHVNERWPAYWAELFGERGFVSVDILRPRIWLDDDVAWYYRQNVFMAVREDALGNYPALRDEYERSHGRVLPLVHPEHFMRIARSSPVRLKDNAVGSLYERWPQARQIRDVIRRAR